VAYRVGKTLLLKDGLFFKADSLQKVFTLAIFITT
jgi:hypothetical protein